MSFARILTATKARTAVASAVGGIGIGSVFGDNDDVPIIGDAQTVTYAIMGLAVVVAVGQLFDIQLGG